MESTMKHKHSPNFFENLQEADTAKNNRLETFIWTLVTVILLMFGFSMASCTEANPDKKRPYIVHIVSGEGFEKVTHQFECDSINVSANRQTATVYIDGKIKKIVADKITVSIINN